MSHVINTSRSRRNCTTSKGIKIPHNQNSNPECASYNLMILLTVGEAAAGKGSRSLAQHIPGQAGMEGMKVAACGVVGDLARARIALDERGQRLGELEERTALMMTSAETFSKHAHEVKTRLLK